MKSSYMCAAPKLFAGVVSAAAAILASSTVLAEPITVVSWGGSYGAAQDNALFNDASKNTDSLDMPLASGDDALVTVAPESPVAEASQVPSRALSSSAVREGFTTTMSSVFGVLSSAMAER